LKKLNPKYFLLIFSVLFFIFSCSDPLAKYKKNGIIEKNNLKISESDYIELYRKNFLNIDNGNPFFIIREKAFLFLNKPSSESNMPSSYIALSFGDVLFSVKENESIDNYFYVRTADGNYGWIESSFGISVNPDEDQNLYFFGKDYYLKSYKDTNGAIDNANKLILLKNIVPMLLGNYSTEGWFYPEDHKLALELSKYGVSISENDQVFFYTPFSVQYWKYNEMVTAYNLLADCYQKFKDYTKAEEIHNMLIKKYFWQKSYNSEIGGLTSIVKLQVIYLEQLKNEKKDSEKYKFFKNKIIDNIITIVNDRLYSMMTSKDIKWRGLTFSEWVLDILQRNVSKEEFHDFCNIIISKTESEGFTDMIYIYFALEKIKEGKKEEAIQFLSTYKPKHNYNNMLRLNDWLSANKVLSDSIIYQYTFN
jgi:hypothetical protein